MIAPGTLLRDRYEIEHLIAHGGFGAVYASRDRHLSRRVAVKQSFCSFPQFEAVASQMRRSFEREAMLLGSLRHPVLPVVSDYFAFDNDFFLVMDYIEGKDLDQMVRQATQRPSWEEVLTWIDQVLDALIYLHELESPIFHRDIKPQNIKLTANGEARLLDFGLARGIVAQFNEMTAGTSVLGYTPNYAPIEQVRGDATDARSDIYSLSATAYYLLSGQKPRDAISRLSKMHEVGEDTIIPLRSLNPELPAGIDFVIMRGLSISANDRPESARRMRSALQQARQGADPETLLLPGRTVAMSRPLVATGETHDLAPAGLGITPAAGGQTVTASPSRQRSPALLWFGGAAALVLALLIGGISWGAGGFGAAPTPTLEPTRAPALNAAPPAPNADLVATATAEARQAAALATASAIAEQQAATATFIAQRRATIEAIDTALALATNIAGGITPSATPRTPTRGPAAQPTTAPSPPTAVAPPTAAPPTAVPPTAVPPTPALISDTPVPAPPTETPEPRPRPNTPVPPTATPEPPTPEPPTPEPPTATPVPPTATPVPPTATPVPPTPEPTDTPYPAPYP